MAGKEATVYIVDLGPSMGEKRNGRSKTNLDWGMEYVWDKITNTISTERKTALMSVIGFRTDETELAGIIDEDQAEGYENITVFSTLKQWLMPDVRQFKAQLKPSGAEEGDVLAALAVAIQHIGAATSNAKGVPLQYARRIIVVTDGQGTIDDSDAAQLAAKIKEDGIEVTILGVDFDDPDFGVKEEDKDANKAENETKLKTFADECDGTFATLEEAIGQLDIPRGKEVRPVASYRGTLTLGDSRTYDAAMTINVERFPCTMIAKPPTASSFVIKTDLSGGAGPSTQSSTTLMGDEQGPRDDLTAVHRQSVYQVDNPDEPGTKQNVEFDDLERGYEYGRTAVHISESDANIVKIETQPCLELIGFVPQEKFERFLPISSTHYIVAQKANSQAELALSAFIHALYEGDHYAIARLVTKENKPPRIVLLAPHIRPDVEALIDAELPFAEDLRNYKFPPLDKKFSITGKLLTEHRDIPNEGLNKAMSDYVDAMDLSKFGRDDDGEPAEYMTIDDTYSPLLHRIKSIIRWRATNDTYDKLPDPPQILTKYSAPPSELLEKAQTQLAALKAAGDVKKVPPKVKGRGKRSLRDREKPLSGLDVDALLGNPKRVKIDPANLIPTFKQALAVTDELEAIQSAADDMAKNIRSLISSSVGESGYGRALEAIRVMREEIAELEEPEIFNNFIRSLKREILDQKLKGDRREMWWRIRGSKYGLIDKKRCTMSDVTEDEAAEFYRGS